MDATPLILFAQKGDDAVAGALGFLVICGFGLLYVVLPLIGLALGIWFYVVAFQALNAVSPHNRDMEPGMIFMMMIPCFGPIWYFFVIIRIASSLRKEYQERGYQDDGDFGQLLGILSAVIPCAGIITLIMWINKIRGYTARLAR